MTGKIDKDGNLHLHRAGVMKPMCCPQNFEMPCGDHCPAFKEGHGQTVTICRDILLTGIVDERRSGYGHERVPFEKFAGMPRAKSQKGKNRLFWTVVSEGLISCPTCGTERDISGMTKHTPRTCKHCGAKLDMPG